MVKLGHSKVKVYVKVALHLSVDYIPVFFK